MNRTLGIGCSKTPRKFQGPLRKLAGRSLLTTLNANAPTLCELAHNHPRVFGKPPINWTYSKLRPRYISDISDFAAQTGLFAGRLPFRTRLTVLAGGQEQRIGFCRIGRRPSIAERDDAGLE